MKVSEFASRDTGPCVFRVYELWKFLCKYMVGLYRANAEEGIIQTLRSSAASFYIPHKHETNKSVYLRGIFLEANSTYVTFTLCNKNIGNWTSN